MKIRSTLSLLFAFTVLCSVSEPVPEFRWPVDFDVRLSGTFGELRSNHFHAGIDIKSPDGGVGAPVLAAADGYINRIKIQEGGYGKALYIQHSGSYSTVYAHLDRFTPEIEEYMRRAQYQSEKFAIQQFPDHQLFPVKKGEIIAYLGNSGYSFGPHLHFEIRKSDVPMNALQFLHFEDKHDPIAHELIVHYLDGNHTRYDSKSISFLKIRNSDTLVFDAFEIGFSVDVTDPFNQGANKNGVYEISMLRDGSKDFHHRYESIPFSKSRYANACMDYEHKFKTGSLNYLFYERPGLMLNLNSSSKMGKKGIVTLHKYAQQIHLISKDFSGNTWEKTFYVKRSNNVSHSSKPYQYKIDYKQPKRIVSKDIKLVFKENTFYQDEYLSIDDLGDSHYMIGSESTPVHRYFQLIIQADEALTDKHFMAFCDRHGTVFNAGGNREGSEMNATVRSLGEYYIEIDTVAPMIELAKLQSIGPSTSMSLRVSDNFPSMARADGIEYRALLNGEWTLVEYAAKNRTIYWKQDLPQGEHLFELRVIDDSGNEAYFQKKIKI